MQPSGGVELDVGAAELAVKAGPADGPLAANDPHRIRAICVTTSLGQRSGPTIGREGKYGNAGLSGGCGVASHDDTDIGLTAESGLGKTGLE
jgi:hypothetical protein